MLIDGEVVLAEVGQPVDGVPASVAARAARGAADHEVGFAAVEMEVLGDLAAGLAAADDQDLAGGKLAAVAVGRGVQLGDREWKAFGEAGDVGLVVAADREDDGVGGVGAIGGFQMEAAARSRVSRVTPTPSLMGALMRLA